MGTITPKISRYWPKRKIEFLKKNWKLSNREIGGKIKKHPKSVGDKRKALKLPFRECDIVPLTFHQKQLIFGSLLGDGSIAKGKEDKNCRFSEGHSFKQKEYLIYKYEKLKPYSGKLIEYPGKYGMECKFSTKAHPTFNQFRKMFYAEDGRKVIRPSTLAQITHPLALATWYGDDGSNDIWDCRLATAKYSIEEIKRLIKWLKATFEIRGFLHKHGKYWYLSIREDRFKFTKLIKSYLPKGLHYKLFS